MLNGQNTKGNLKKVLFQVLEICFLLMELF